MLPFAVGTACVVVPQFGLPVLGVAAAVKGIKGLAHRAKGQKDSKAVQEWTDLAHLLGSKPPPVTLRWQDITCVLNDKKHGTTKTLLDGITGKATPGRLLAIMGPSGSGKTTLLNTLASQVPSNKRMELSGNIVVNGVAATESNHKQAYVQQEDVFYSQLTVLETMTMAAQLRLPPSLSAEDKATYVDKLLKLLGLGKVANSRVGDAKRRGLSGGEKKRLSLGCELVGSPSLIFLDEPTSGLDAAAAEKVMSTLKALAAAGHTVVASIHQPRSSIWEMFDDLILLHEGQMVYQGPAEEALGHFEALGHVCPPHHNPAEFLADLISPDYCAPQQQKQQQPGEANRPSDSGNDAEQSAARSRVQALVEAWAKHGILNNNSPVKGTRVGDKDEDEAVREGVAGPLVPAIPWGQQFKLLARRSWKQVVRDKAAAVARIGANLSSAIIFGAIFFRMGRSQSSIQDRMGLMQVVAINTAMGSLAKTLNVFPRERLIVNRERARHSYRTAAYLAGKLLAELPIGAVFPLLFGVSVYPLCGLNPRLDRFARFLGIITLESFTSSAFGLMVGAFAPSTEAAMAIGPAAMTVWIVFGGYYVNAENVPGVLKWLPKASLIKQAFAALVINEFKGSSFEPDAHGRGMTDGQQVLEWLSFDKSTVSGALVQQARITAVYYMAAYSILCANKPRFQPMLPPRVKPSSAAGAAAAKRATSQSVSGATAAAPAKLEAAAAAVQDAATAASTDPSAVTTTA